jgi:ribokinase
MPVDVVDNTGAGDAFAGALAVALLQRRDPQTAARFAVTTAALTVTKYGSQPAYPTREDLESHLSNGVSSRKW